MLPSHDLPGFRDLPALRPDEVAAIAEQTQAALSDLLSRDSFAANTVRSYSSALLYWDAWHRAAYGRALPLLDSPRAPVPSEAVLAFIAHHSPAPAVADGVPAGMAMPDPVRQRMHQLNAIGTRLAARRSRGRLADDVPTVATVKHRVVSLSACHRIANLEPPFADDPRVRQALRALTNRAGKQAPAMLRQPKAAVGRALMTAMLASCVNDGLLGVRDAALLHVAFHTGGRRRSELAAMRWPDLTPLNLVGEVHGQRDGYTWSLWEVKGRRRERSDAAILAVPILGPAAAALDAWRDAVLAHDLPADGPVWYRVVKSPEGEGAWVPSTPMIAADVWHMIRARAAAVGMNPDDFGAHSLRSGAVTTFLDEGGALADASAMVGHSKLDTTRDHYDQRGVPLSAVAKLVSRSKS